ncbi:DUF4189 domain-containing protein [Nocardia thailandica]|uniref:DUF4189 domain-containing protein n=1 Tax=Nocardia thailandica TaxID=257275 RepID=A0ABW6PP65_9NOCA|nr:DUF4189 domain-containing protein [Nocardia thailandica]
MKLMSKAGLAVAGLGLAAGSLFGAGTANAAGLHGAIALSGGDLVYATVVDAASREEAEGRALELCGVADCSIMVSWANGCGTLVASDDGWAAASGANAADSERTAYQRLSQITPTAQLANFGSAQLSNAEVLKTVCTANAR